MVNMSSAASSQAFRVRTSPSSDSSSTSDIISIPTRPDPKSGQRIVLWRDIKQFFENAKAIMNGEDAVLFLTDDNFEYLMPERILHHEGVVLEVVVANTNNSNGGNSRNGGSSVYGASTTSLVTDGAPDDTVLPTVTLNTSPTHLQIPQREDTAEETHPSFETYHKMYTSYSEALLAGQVHQAVTIKRAMKEHIRDMSNSTVVDTGGGGGNSKSLHERVLQMQLLEERNHSNKTITSDAYALTGKRQHTPPAIRASTFSRRLNDIDRRIQAVIERTHELHEDPMPRLFIVLPKVTSASSSNTTTTTATTTATMATTRVQDKLSGENKRLSTSSTTSAIQFRLFFLCECGAHTMNGESTTPHEIHLAKHEGYDLERPADFFEQYGSYVLTMMQMIKYGYRTAGLVVPSMGHSKTPKEGKDHAASASATNSQSNPDFLTESFASLVDDMIAYIQTKTKTGSDATRETEELEKLENIDLRQLVSYLRFKDRKRHDHLGRLYRTVTSEGYVKWVCIDHYREDHQEPANARLKEVVVANGGSYSGDLGKIVIQIQSEKLAEQFYDVLVKVRGIQELDMTFNWDATMSELYVFAAAVSEANIVHLTIDGTFLVGPSQDIMNWSRRFDPVIQLISNGRLQALRLRNFKDFYARISGKPMASTPMIRVMSIDAAQSFNGQSDVLLKILGHCPMISELTIETYTLDHTFEALTSNGFLLRSLKKLVLNGFDASVTVGFAMGRIKSMNAKALLPLPAHTEHWKILWRGHLTHLRINSTPRATEEEGLVSILNKNPNLSIIEIVCEPYRMPAIIDLIVSTRAEHIGEHKSSALRKLQLFWDDRLSDEEAGAGDVVSSLVEFEDPTSASPSVSVDIRMQDVKEGRKDDNLELMMHLYGWCIKTLDADRTLNDHLIILLDGVTAEKGSNLTSLVLDPSALSMVGIDSVDRVIGCSSNLRYLGFHLNYDLVKDKSRQDKLQWLICRHGKRLNGLTLGSKSDGLSLPQLARMLPSRLTLPEIDTFQLSNYTVPSITHACVQWVASMVSEPPRNRMSSPSPAFQSSVLDSAATVFSVSPSSQWSEDERAWKPLKSIGIDYAMLEPDDWTIVIEAIDYSELEVLNFEGSNFTLEQLQGLVLSIHGQCIDELPLRLLNLSGTPLSFGNNVSEVQELLATLEKAAPFIKIEGVSLQ